MIKGITHNALRVKDIEKSVKFYTDVLGFKEAFRMHNKDTGALGAVYLYITQNQFIELFPNGQGEVKIDPMATGPSHLCYLVEDARAAVEEVRAKGAPIDVDVKVGNSKCIMFWTHDPDGNRIEIMELPPESLQAQANKTFE